MSPESVASSANQDFGAIYSQYGGVATPESHEVNGRYQPQAMSDMRPKINMAGKPSMSKSSSREDVQNNDDASATQIFGAAPMPPPPLSMRRDKSVEDVIRAVQDHLNVSQVPASKKSASK